MSESPRKEVIKIMIENGVKLSYGTDSHACINYLKETILVK